MECVEGVRKADAGRATVLGLDPARDAKALQERIGVQLQQAQLQSASASGKRSICGRRSTRAPSTVAPCSSSSD